jgi:N-acyl-D-aspartate/D-glutamate deacylase
MQTSYDLLIRNATIVDGTEAIRYTADIGIYQHLLVKQRLILKGKWPHLVSLMRTRMTTA